MRRNTLKLMALTSAIALSFAFTNNSFAQTETVNATLITSSAITSADVSDMDFGTWLIQLTAAEISANGITITLTDDQSATSTAGSIDNSSQVVQITAPASEGVVTVQTPAPSTLTMSTGTLTDFTDPGLTLSSVTWNSASTPSATIAMSSSATVTVTAGATDERIDFGGVITADGSNPVDGTHTASFDVTFTY